MITLYISQYQSTKPFKNLQQNPLVSPFWKFAVDYFTNKIVYF